MKFDDFMDVLGGVVLVALATTIVSSKYTAQQISAAGSAFGGIINSALGKG